MGSACDCPLNQNAEVPYITPKGADIYICGESPGRMEIKERSPFVGPSGHLMKKAFAEVGIDDWSSIGRVNAARCLIHKDSLNAKQISAVLRACRPRLIKALAKAAPKVVVVLGDIALRQLTGKTGIAKARGRLQWSDELGCWLLPAFHPAYCLRDPKRTPTLVRDLRTVADLRNADWKESVIQEAVRYRELPDFSILLEALNADEGPLRFSLDTETTGVDWLAAKTHVVCVSFSFAEGTAGVVFLHEPVDSEDKGKADVLQVFGRTKVKNKWVPTQHGIRPRSDTTSLLIQLRDVIEHPNTILYMQNGNFDRHMLDEQCRRNGLRPPVWNRFLLECQAAAHVLNENEFVSASLETLRESLTSFRSDYSRRFAEQYGYEDMFGIPRSVLVEYAGGDADTTLRVGNALRERLIAADPRLRNYFVEFVQPTIRDSLYTLEQNGSVIDFAAIPGVKKEVETRMASEHAAALALLPRPVADRHRDKLKLTRNALLEDAMYSDDGFGLPQKGHVTKKGKGVTDKPTRTQFIEAPKTPARAREFLEHVNAWKELHTLSTRYLAGFSALVRSDGRIHSRYSLTNAATGRTSSRDPNMQNNPKRSANAHIIRRLIVAPEGRVLLAIDQSQSELRWAAHVADDVAMRRIFREGLDIHTVTAETISGKSADSMTKSELSAARQNAKPLNFGVLYSISAPTYAVYAKQNYKVVVTKKEAERLIAAWFEKYSGIARYHREIVAFARRHGYVESPFGRRRRLLDINSENPGPRAFAERQAINHPIQGASSDTVLLALNELLRDKVLDPDRCTLVNFVHDEAVFEIENDPAYIKECFAVIKHYMENPPFERFGFSMSVPLVVDAKIGPNLADMKPLVLDG